MLLATSAAAVLYYFAADISGLSAARGTTEVGTIGVFVMVGAIWYSLLRPFRSSRRTSLYASLVISVMAALSVQQALAAYRVASQLTWPIAALCGAVAYLPARRWLKRKFGLTLTQYIRSPADQATAEAMAEESERMIADPQTSAKEQRTARLNQARALIAMSESLLSRDGLVRAADLLAGLAADPESDQMLMFRALWDLVRALDAKADKHGDLLGYAEALDMLAVVAARMPAGEDAWVVAHSCAARFELTLAVRAVTAEEARTHLDAAIGAHRHAIDAVTSEGRPLLPQLYAELARSIAARYDDLSHLDEALALCRRGGRLAWRSLRRRALPALVTAELLQQRAWARAEQCADDLPDTWRTSVAADLRRAARICRRVRRTGPSSLRREAAEQLAAVESDLGLLGEPRSESSIAAAWRRSAEASRHDIAEASMRVRMQWVDWAVTTGDPRWCAEAYESLMAAIGRGAATFYLAEERDRLLANVQHTAEEAGYWMARRGQIHEAAVALERGRAVAISEALGRERFDLPRILAEAGRDDLVKRLQDATQQLRQAERGAVQEDQDHVARFTTPIQRAWSRYDAARREACRVAGVETDAEVSYRDIAAGAGEGPLVYLAAAERSGYAVIVADSGTPEWVPLPLLTRDRVRQYACLPDADERRSTVAPVLRWLWENGIAHLSEQLRNGALVTLVPVGLLSLLPIHAAGGPSSPDQGPADWQFLADRLTVRYGPNARTLAHVRERAAALEGAPLSLLAFAAPTGDPNQPLEYTQIELANVCLRWDGPTLTRLDKAGCAEVEDALGSHSVWHFAGHCDVLPGRIRSSALMLERGRLTLDSLLARPPSARRLAVLSGCRSHRSGEDLPDEAMGLPGGLLQAGLAGVVATHWNVGDGSAAFVAAKFYEAWRAGGRTPAHALSAAQQWVRQATHEDLHAYLPGIVRLPRDCSPRNMARWAVVQPYSHPYSWAAFALTGV